MDPNPRFATRKASDEPAAPSEASPLPEQADLTAQWEQYFAVKTEQTQSFIGVELKLPSGLSVRAKRPHLMVLMKDGKIPDALTPLVQQMISLMTNGLAEAPVKAVMQEYERDEATAFANMVELLDTVWVNAVVEPIFVRNPSTQRGAAKPGEKVYPVSGVRAEDKLFLFAWCQGVSDDLATFRAGQDRIAEALSRKQNVFDVALDLARDTERVRKLASVPAQ